MHFFQSLLAIANAFLLAPAVSVVNCLFFMTWNEFFAYRFALLPEGEERVRSDLSLRVKNIVVLVARAAAPLFSCSFLHCCSFLLFTWARARPNKRWRHLF